PRSSVVVTPAPPANARSLHGALPSCPERRGSGASTDLSLLSLLSRISRFSRFRSGLRFRPSRGGNAGQKREEGVRRGEERREERSEEHTSELQSREKLVCGHVLENKK